MINQEELENIKKAVEEFFRMAGYSVEQEMNQGEESGQEVLSINIKTSDAQTLIGKQGLVLSDIQLILRKAIKKKTGREIYLNLDIDNYKRNKEDYLKGLAWNMADEVASTGREKELPLLSPFDRRVVHMELAERKDVVAESIGEGEERRIVIKPSK
jgi:spoIIIJ-associated protein